MKKIKGVHDRVKKECLQRKPGSRVLDFPVPKDVMVMAACLKTEEMGRGREQMTLGLGRLCGVTFWHEIAVRFQLGKGTFVVLGLESHPLLRLGRRDLKVLLHSMVLSVRESFPAREMLKGTQEQNVLILPSEP